MTHTPHDTPGTEPAGRRAAPWRLPLWGAIVVVLMAPLVAMRFTREVAWDATDFFFAGGLLIGAGLLFELCAWKVHKPLWRLAVALGLLAVVVVVWADAAVGIF